MKEKPLRSRHSMVSEIIREEITERKWTAESVSLVGGCSVAIAERCINGQHRLTMIDALILGRAFGLSERFFHRLQDICESKYPERPGN